MSYAAELTDIRKRFGSVLALDGAGLRLARGEIHGLLGQNGAGKTTLARVLGGLLQPDSGTVTLDGELVHIASVAQARSLGIRVVHQHFSLVPRFTGYENVALFNDGAWNRSGRPTPDYTSAVEARARELGLPAVLNVAVERLGVGDRQRIEVLKALMSETKVLILDEPTAVLTPAEVDGLFRVLRNVAQAGTAVCLIAHKLDEVLSLADRVTVLTDGRTALTRETTGLSVDEVVLAMVGEAVDKEDGPTSTKGEALAEPVAVLHQVDLAPDGGPGLAGVSLEVARGEVLGVAGVEGNGQRELASVLAGVAVPERGRVALPHRVGWIPQDRDGEGLIADFSLAENAALALHDDPRYRKGPYLDWEKVRVETERLIESQEVVTPGPSARARTLSGGNQQKLLTARELGRSRDLLVAESPTRGLDVKAAQAVRRQIRGLARGAEPAGVVLISTDLDEVLTLSDRIMVMVRGRLVAVPPGASTRAEVGRLMLGAETT